MVEKLSVKIELVDSENGLTRQELHLHTVEGTGLFRERVAEALRELVEKQHTDVQRQAEQRQEDRWEKDLKQLEEKDWTRVQHVYKDGALLMRFPDDTIVDFEVKTITEC